jgi:hypothetical protein
MNYENPKSDKRVDENNMDLIYWALSVRSCCRSQYNVSKFIQNCESSYLFWKEK